MTLRSTTFTPALLALTLIMASPLPALAQTQTPAAVPESDPVAALLRSQGEAYRRAPDSSQDPDELRRTQALNAEIVAQNELAESQEQADRLAHDQAQAAYQRQIETARQAADIERQAFETQLRAAEDARARHEREMADWRATVAACERGDRARCMAGREPAQSRP